ncbi:MAG: tRNA pseudouridine(38-40) synthase TruA [Clostridiaceae bacterium]|nr:tRNA pseudouridine(38-40) synthase TruA [Clostridiaceae bacterium]
MRNIKLTIEYDGTRYNGWQSQPGGLTIQDMLEAAIYKLTNEKAKVTGAGRTDAGVHAYGQVANFYTASSIPAGKFSFALNTMLPGDIVVTKSEEVSLDFHARFSAKGKKYEYLIYNSIHPPALLKDRAWHVFYNLDVEAMNEAALHLAGTHDFAGFAARDPSRPGLNTIRTIREVSVERISNIIRISISGDGFLYNMARIITGTLVDIGRGKMEAGRIKSIIDKRDRKLAGMTAPPQGLYLVEVYY